jgi:hypothetical protein
MPDSKEFIKLNFPYSFHFTPKFEKSFRLGSRKFEKKKYMNVFLTVPLQVNFLDDDILLWCLYSFFLWLRDYPQVMRQLNEIAGAK